MNTVMRADDPNLAILTRIAQALGDLCDSLVFVGGCATGLLVTSVRAQPIRATEDVDFVAQVTNVHEYHGIEARLQARGFAHDMSPDAPICRWVYQGIKADLMPSQPGILGFHNRWYPLAIETALSVNLPSTNIAIRLISAPVFIATKLEAFKGRGKEDYLVSHDLEDIVTIVDGRATLIDEIRRAPEELRRYLSMEFKTLVALDAFLDALPGHLPGDSGSQQRLPDLIKKFRSLAELS